MAEQERKPGERIGQSIMEITEEGVILYAMVRDAIRRGGPFDDQMAAALGFVEQFSGATRRLLEASGSAISFSNNGSQENPVASLQYPQDPAEDPPDLKPRTFGQLLRQQVEALFPEDRTAWSLAQIKGTIKVKRVSIKNFINAGIDKKGSDNFSRGEAILVTIANLTTPGGRLVPQEQYTSGDVIRSFLISSPQLNRWSQQVGYDWKAHPAVDFDTAMQLRGLHVLETRILGLPKETLQS